MSTEAVQTPTAVAIVPIYDATHVHIGDLPPGQHAGYVTGTPDIVWTTGDWLTHPHAVRIDQSPASGPWDSTADVQDYELLAVTLAELPNRVHGMLSSYKAGMRPGQRSPAVYVGARHNATPVVNALIGAGITSGIGLAVAAPGISDAAAISMIESTHGTPWPIIWVQNRMGGTYDAGFASVHWLDTVSSARGPLPRQVVEVTVHFSDGSSEVFG